MSSLFDPDGRTVLPTGAGAAVGRALGAGLSGPVGSSVTGATVCAAVARRDVVVAQHGEPPWKEQPRVWPGRSMICAFGTRLDLDEPVIRHPVIQPAGPDSLAA